jgi:hypothetical protein
MMDMLDGFMVCFVCFVFLSACVLAAYPGQVMTFIGERLPMIEYPKVLNVSDVTAYSDGITTEITISNTKLVKMRPLCTGSMLPTFGCNSTIYGEVLDADDEVHVSDIIVYNNSRGDYISHRIVAINQDGTYTLRGDNNPTEDMPVRRGQMLYRVIGILYTISS